MSIESLEIERPHARLDRTKPEHISPVGLRAYRCSPDELALQIRTKTEKTGYYHHLQLNHAQAVQLRDFLGKFIRGEI